MKYVEYVKAIAFTMLTDAHSRKQGKNLNKNQFDEISLFINLLK